MSYNDQNAFSEADQPTDTFTSQQSFEVLSSESQGADDDFEGQLALKNLEKRRAEQKRKKRIKIIAGCAVAAGVLAVVLGSTVFAGGSADEEEYVPETAIVERGDFESTISASGALKAGSTVVVTPEVDGTIESVSVSEGQQVKKGDVLFTLKNDSLDKAVRDASADVTAAQQQVSNAQSDVDNAVAARDDTWNRYYSSWNEADEAHREWEYARANYDADHADWEDMKSYAESLKMTDVEPVAPVPPTVPTDPDDTDHKGTWDNYRTERNKYDELYRQYSDNKKAWDKYQRALAELDAQFPAGEPQPAGAEPAYPEKPDDISLVAAIDSANESVTTANQSLQKANEAYEQAVENADKRVVKAPSSGNIVAMSAKVGEPVFAGASSTSGEKTSSALVQISDVNKMSVDIEVNEIDIMSVKKGQQAKVTFSAVPDIECDAVVTEVSSVASGTAEGGGIVTFHVGLVIEKPDAKLRPGMTASVKLITTSVKDALTVPVGALTETEAGTSVEVVVDEETLETEARLVKVGPRDSSTAVIEEGLNEGDMVLIGGAGVVDDMDAEAA